MRFLPSSFKRVIIATLLVLICGSCSSLGSEGRECVRVFSDGEIQDILSKQGLVPVAYKASINWVECKYYIAIWELPVTPDTQKIVVLDSAGKLVEGPR
jgi:hypothetical protein